VVKDGGAGTITVYQDDGATPATEQDYTSTGGVDTVGKAS
jgi:hypothetical protein